MHRWRFDNWLDLIVRSDAPALRSVHPGVKPLTFVALAEFIEDELATMVAHCGILPKDRLCTVMPNGPEAAVAFLGFSLFCTFAPLNPTMREADYEFEFEDLPVPGQDANLFVVVMRDEVSVQEQVEVFHLLALEELGDPAEPVLADGI